MAARDASAGAGDQVSDEARGGAFPRLLRSVRKHGLLGTLRVLAALAVVVLLFLFSQPTRTSVALGAVLVLLGEGWRA